MATRSLKQILKPGSELQPPLTEEQWRWFREKPRRVLHNGRLVKAEYGTTLFMGETYDIVKAGDEILFMRVESFFQRECYQIQARTHFTQAVNVLVHLKDNFYRGPLLVWTASIIGDACWIARPGESIIVKKGSRLLYEASGRASPTPKVMLTLHYREAKFEHSPPEHYVELIEVNGKNSIRKMPMFP